MLGKRAQKISKKIGQKRRKGRPERKAQERLGD